MAKFSRGAILTAEIEIRIAQAALNKELANLRNQVNKTTDLITERSISKMKDRTAADLRTTKLAQTQSIRLTREKIAANNDNLRQLKFNARVQAEADRAKKIADADVIKRLNTQIKSEERASRERARQENEEANRLARRASALRMLGVQVTILGAIITVTFKKMLDQFTEFDRAMRKATAVTDFTEKQFKEMSDMAERASINLNIAASDTADAFYYLGSAGLNAKEQMQAFNSVVTLAKAATIEAGQAAEIMVNTMKGFKLEFTESAHVAAVMAEAVISSNMNFLQLGETLSLVAGVARTTNNSLEETVAMIQLMANVGIKGTRAGTTLRRSMINLAAPSEKIERLFRDMNVSIEDQSGKIKPYIQLIGEISDALRNASERQRVMAFDTLFGARAIAGQLELFSAGSAVLQRMVLDLKLVGDTHEEIAKKQLAAFGEQIGTMYQSVANLSRHLTSKFAPALSLISGNLKRMIENVTKFIDKNEILASVIVGSGIALGGLLSVAGSGLTVFASLSMVSMGLGKSFAQMAAMAAPWAAIIAGLIIATTIYVAIIAKEEARQKSLNGEIGKNREYLDKAREAYEKYHDAMKKLDLTPEQTAIQNKMDTLEKSLITATKKATNFAGALYDANRAATMIPDWILEREALQAGLNLSDYDKDVYTPSLGAMPGTHKQIRDVEALMKDLHDYQVELMVDLQEKIAKTEKEFTDSYNKTLKERGDLTTLWKRETINTVVSMIEEIKGEEAAYNKFAKQQLKYKIEDMRTEFQEREWLSEENKALATEEFDHWLKLFEKRKQKEIAYESAKRGDSFKMGFSSQASQMGDEVERLGEIGQKAADIFQQGIADSLGAAVRNAGNLKEAMISVVQSVENALLDMATQIIAKQLMSMMFSGMFDKSVDLSIAATNQTSAATMLTASAGNVTAGGEMIASSVAMNVAAGQMMAAAIMHGASSGTSALGSIVGSAGMANFMSPAGPGGVPLPTGHSGGLVGSLSRSKRVSPFAFAGAPRLHGGLASDEMATILQRGEVVLSRNNVAELRDESGRQDKGSTSKSGSTGAIAVNISITAMDSKSVLGALAPLKKEITSMVQAAGRNNHTIRRN